MPEEPVHERKVVCPSYTRDVFSPETFPGIVEWAAAQIAAQQPKIGAVAGSGHSGVLVAAVVGYKLRLPVIAVRKHEEDTGYHSMESVNAILQGTERYAIVDDLIASGTTMRRIAGWVEQYFPKAIPALVLLYHDSYGIDSITLGDGPTPIIRMRNP